MVWRQKGLEDLKRFMNRETSTYQKTILSNRFGESYNKKLQQPKQKKLEFEKFERERPKCFLSVYFFHNFHNNENKRWPHGHRGRSMYRFISYLNYLHIFTHL